MEQLMQKTPSICLGHKPEWINVGPVRFEPRFDQFGRSYDVMRHCCDTATFGFYEMQTKRCNYCGREQNFHLRSLGICSACGNMMYNKDREVELIDALIEGKIPILD